MKYNKFKIDLYLLRALETGYFYFGEMLELFAGDSHLRFIPEEKNRIIIELTDVEVNRYILSLLYIHEDEICMYDFSPYDIIMLTKEVKLILIKCVARGGYMPNEDAEICNTLLFCKSYMLHLNDVAKIQHEKASDFFDLIEKED